MPYIARSVGALDGQPVPVERLRLLRVAKLIVGVEGETTIQTTLKDQLQRVVPRFVVAHEDVELRELRQRAGEPPAWLYGARRGRRLIDIRIHRDVAAARADVPGRYDVAREFPLYLHVELLHARRLEIQIDRAKCAREVLRGNRRCGRLWRQTVAQEEVRRAAQQRAI